LITDPRSAPERGDLPWMRRRTRPKASPPLADFITGRAEHPRARESTAPAPAPAASSSLDLDAPAPAVRPPAAAPVLPATSPSVSLDLDQPVAAARPVVARPAAAPKRSRRVDVRVAAGGRVILRPVDPTVTLTRMQSGIGRLRMEAACSGEVGDLRIGCAYELTSGVSGTVQMTQGNRLAPGNSRRPVVVAGHETFEHIDVDLRQTRDLRRLIVYGFSESRSPLKWGGTLVTTTFGGARVELPLETLEGGAVAVLQSVYVVDGEFVLRAEMQTLYGDVREAARTYGFDRITWLDDRTTVDSA
jgi:hypothetical protein